MEIYDFLVDKGDVVSELDKTSYSPAVKITTGSSSICSTGKVAQTCTPTQRKCDHKDDFA